MIGIIGAMEIEVKAILELVEDAAEETVGGVRFTRGKIEGKEVAVAACGVGKVFAAMCAQAMILRYAPKVIVNTGVAGSLAPGIAIGDIVVARDALQHDMDTSPLGDTLGAISGLGLVKIPCAAPVADVLLESIREAGGKGHSGTVASGDQFIHEAEKKRWIGDTFGAACCEMEGAAIAQVCYVNGVDCGIVRAISDNADGSAGVDFLSFLFPAVELSTKVMRYFVAKF